VVYVEFIQLKLISSGNC